MDPRSKKNWHEEDTRETSLSYDPDWDDAPEPTEHTKLQKIDVPVDADETVYDFTIPQKQAFINPEMARLKQAMSSGALYKGNVELAAVLGYAPAQKLLGRKVEEGMSKDDFIKFLLSDPNLRIDINVSDD